jgi:hypothetical protein
MFLSNQLWDRGVGRKRRWKEWDPCPRQGSRPLGCVIPQLLLPPQETYASAGWPKTLPKSATALTWPTLLAREIIKKPF